MESCVTCTYLRQSHNSVPPFEATTTSVRGSKPCSTHECSWERRLSSRETGEDHQEWRQKQRDTATTPNTNPNPRGTKVPRTASQECRIYSVCRGGEKRKILKRRRRRVLREHPARVKCTKERGRERRSMHARWNPKLRRAARPPSRDRPRPRPPPPLSTSWAFAPRRRHSAFRKLTR